MIAEEVYDAVYRYFINYDYKLFNTYLYAWESDFFAVSGSGYQVEVEVKVSRGDYLADYLKDKHLLFRDHVSKKMFHIERQAGMRYGEHNLVCAFTQPEIQWQFTGEHGRRGYYDRPWAVDYKDPQLRYWANDYGECWVSRQKVEVRAPYTRIEIRKIDTILCPHSFYFACPEGLIKAEELPRYAGLIYVGKAGASLIRKAPHMHKYPMQITGLLLRKFHNLWRYSQSVQQQMKAAETYTEGQLKFGS